MLRFLALLVTTLTALAAGPSHEPQVEHYYANQTPYGTPATAQVRSPPDGYDLVFLETVGRHGARTLTSPDREGRVLRLADAASRAGAVTPLGERLVKDVKAFQVVERQIGYGDLSAVGRAEWRGIGRRTAATYRTFLRQAAERGEPVEFKTSPVQRTIDSADAMRTALERAVPQLTVAPYVTDPATLLIVGGTSPAGSRALGQVETRPEVVAAARHLLSRLWSEPYVRTIEDPLQAAEDVYLLYSTAPGLRGDTDVTFRRYVPRRDAKVLAYAVDAGNFYAFGPGVEGEDSSYQAARPLLKDFLDELDARLGGGRTAAVFRLAHGETTMPFAALLGLPGSDTQAPATRPFSYADNPWRGSVAGRLAGSIEWAAYRSRSGRALVTVRHNEQPVELKASCRPTRPFFYRPAELRRCLG